MPSFSRSLEKALHQALALAGQRHQEYATLEHLLLALLEDQDAAAVMRASSRNIRTNSSSPLMSGRICLSTTSFWKPASPLWNARKMTDIPPVESRQRTSYFPNFLPV